MNHKRKIPAPDPRIPSLADGTPPDRMTKIQDESERTMRLYIDGSVNKYYIQTLCMIFFPGSKFSDDEPVTEDTPEMWVSMQKSPEAGIDVTAKLSYRGQSAEAVRHYDYVGGVCITLYGFIAVSGLKMIQKVDLEDNANLFTVSAILIPGIGGMAMAIGGKIFITPVACALILGIVTNLVLTKFKKEKKED